MPRSDVTFFDDRTATAADHSDQGPAATPEGDQLHEARLAGAGQSLREDTMADYLAKYPTG